MERDRKTPQSTSSRVAELLGKRRSITFIGEANMRVAGNTEQSSAAGESLDPKAEIAAKRLAQLVKDAG